MNNDHFLGKERAYVLLLKNKKSRAIDVDRKRNMPRRNEQYVRIDELFFFALRLFFANI